MMISDEERREVTARLRDSAGNSELLRNAFLEEILAGDTGFAFGEDILIDSLLRHLADLIEPSEPEIKYTAEVKVDGWRIEELAHGAAVELTGIDRDALLALADDIDKQTDGSMFDAWLEDGHYIARRIREALGVDE